MIEQITDKEQLEELLYQHTKTNRDYKGFWTMARLQPEVIEQWKQEGYFRFIKSQLQNLNITFACTQDNDGACEYYFILPSRELKNRVYHMLNTLWTLKKKEPLVKCPTTWIESRYECLAVHGQVKACPLF